jgi:DUF4097 and DUF4098 domain-containing protein YvlB
VGPVILIGLGVLFLLNNLRPFSFWQNIGRYWPFLLILFGVIRLGEVLVSAGQGQPLAPRRGGGSGLGLLIVLCVVLWAVGHSRTGSIHLGNWNSGSLEIFGEQFDYPVSSKGSAAGVNLVVLDGLRGNVTVTGGDDEEYSAEGRKTVRAYQKSDADEADRRSELKFVREGNQLVLKVDNSRVSGDRKISTEIDLKIPRGVSLETRGGSGDVTVSSIDGTVEINADRGDMRLNDIGGNAKLSVTRSSLIRVVDAKQNVDLDGRGTDVQIMNAGGQVTVNGSYSGTLEFKNLAKPLHFESPNSDMRVEKLPGTLTLDLGDLRVNHVEGPMKFHTKSRDVHIEDFSDEMEIDITEHGDIELATSRTPLGKIDVHTKNGDIDLALPDKAVFDLNAATRQGDGHNEYGPALKLELDGRSASIKSVDGHGPAVTANTDRGSISVKKSAAERD